MAFKIRYTFNIDYVGPGAGPMEGLAPAAGIGLPGGGSTGQTKGFVYNPSAAGIVVAGAGAGNTLTAGDVTNLTNSMAADAVTQINAALAQINGFTTGNP